MMSGRKILKYSGITLLSILGVIVLLLMLLNLAIRSQNVQNLVEHYSKEYMNAEVKMDTVEIHLLKNFPYASLSVKDCRIRSLAFDSLDSAKRALVPAKADSLARIGSLNISLSLVDLFFDNINIKKVELESSEIYGYISQFGINNWDIMKIESDTTDTKNDSLSFDININKISIDNGARISLCSVPDSLRVDLSLDELLLKGRLSSKIDDNFLTQANVSRLVFSAGHFNKVILDSTLDNSLKFSVDTLDISKKKRSDMASVDLRVRTDLKFHGISLARNIPFDLLGKLRLQDLDDDRLGVELDDFTVYAATLPVTMDGSLVITDDGIEIPGLNGHIDGYNIKNILEYIPEKFLERGSVETDAAVTLRTEIKGKYQFATGELPTVDLSLLIPSNTLTVTNSKTGHKGTLRNIEASVGLHFDQGNPKSNVLDIAKLNVDGRSISLDVAGKIKEYTDDALFDLNVKSSLNLDTLGAMIPMDTKIVAHGSAEGHVSLKGRMSTLNMFSLSRNDITAEITSDALRLEMPEQGVDFNCGKTSFRTGVLKNSSDTLLTKGNKIFNVSLDLDTLYLSYKDSMLVSGSKIALSANQEPPKDLKKPSTGDNKRLPPLKFDGKLNLGGLSFIDSDSMRVRLRGTESSFSIVPWTDGSTPVISFNAGFKAAGVTQSGLRAIANNSNLSLRIVAHSPKRSVSDTTISGSRKPSSDSTQKPAFNTKRFARTVLKYWDVRGNIKSARGRIITPAFPLRTRFSNVDLTVSNDGLYFQDAKVNVGNSSLAFSGKLQGFAKAVTEHEKLSFNGSIVADSIDIDQIMQACSNSRDVFLDESRSDDDIERAMEKAANADTTAMKAPVLPGYLDSNLDLNLKNVTFQKNTLKSIHGNLVGQNGIFLLNGFKIATESGEIDMSAFYAAKTLDDISLGFDMRMKKFEISDIIGLIPGVDSLLPMLRSFSGKITCTLSAMSKMDSLFNMDMKTINGIVSLDGENVVLLDGETFAEIAKMLKFKNRDKNIIDRISVQCVASDSKIEIFPFVIQMDRYKAAVSGTQRMDMSFKYHISVLKSPLPFRVGLNITGTPDDMNFKIGRCLYKSENVPVYSTVIDSARVNLAKEIRGVFRNGVEKTFVNVNAAALAKVAEAEQNKANDMDTLSNKERQQLESTK